MYSRIARAGPQMTSRHPVGESKAMSTYASVLVALDLGPHVVARTKIATDIADRYHGHLIGAAGRQLLRSPLL